MKDIHNPETIIKNQVRLIKAFKTQKLKVVLSIPDTKKTAHNPVMYRLWGEEFKDDPKAKEVVEELRVAYDKIVVKPEYSIFYNTDFGEYCREHDIDELYFTGIFSGCCVYFSAVDAAYRRIQPYMVTDAVGGPKDGISVEYNTYESFETMIGPLITTDEVIKELKVDV